MQPKTTAKDMGTDTTDDSLTGVNSVEIGTVESLGQGYSKSNVDTADDAILRAQGHKAAMPRLFSIVSTMGLMFWYVILGLNVFYHSQLTQCTSIMNAWVGSLSTFGQNLRYGGPQLVIFAALVAAFVQWVVTLGLSELASAFPSSGVST